MGVIEDLRKLILHTNFEHQLAVEQTQAFSKNRQSIKIGYTHSVHSLTQSKSQKSWKTRFAAGKMKQLNVVKTGLWISANSFVLAALL